MSNDTNATPFKITSAGPHMTRDGRRVEVIPEHDMGEYRWRVVDIGTFLDSGHQWGSRSPSDNDIVARADAPTPPPIPAPTNDAGKCQLAPGKCPFPECANNARTVPTPTRLDRARAALEEARANVLRLWQAKEDAIRAHFAAQWHEEAAFHEVVAAEKEEAARVVIPAALVEVAREALGGGSWSPGEVVCMLAESHGIPIEAIRARLESEKP